MTLSSVVKDRAVPIKLDTVPAARDEAEALQMILDARAMLMEYGRIETGTIESQKLSRAYAFFASKHNVKGQSGNLRRDPEFYFKPPQD